MPLTKYSFSLVACNLHSYLYRGLNCPDRHPQPPEDTDTEIAKILEVPDFTRNQTVSALEFNFEDGFVFVFLSVIIIATFFASVFIFGALFTNKGVRRPYNQVSRYSSLFY